MISLNNISKTYKNGETDINALKNIELDISPNEITIILGPSGSGKSTLLNILGGIDTPSSGELVINNTLVKEKDLPSYRRHTVGFVFQFYNLISNLTAFENVAIAEQLNESNENQAEKLLEKVGLLHRIKNFPDQLSGGEMQRVAIARALAKKPTLLLCDEPTGALDSSTSQSILQLLTETSDKNTAVVIVTHNDKVAELGHRVIKLKDGEISSIKNNEKPKKVSEVNWE
ncbi:MULTISPECIES: ABC transporter ATP-binding protein [Lactococcus]|uniref:ABC transporter ATP-binding protein n=1 Tax=Lactococcus lactis subsp. cremoris TaxID=1359 RepID=A0A166JE81_LACLC|nr:ABC transporter ATP-binding protein [Lactococcus cremoris]KZK06129.1 ABC transporter ATP-binding protein [Lactococcus cremoris]